MVARAAAGLARCFARGIGGSPVAGAARPLSLERLWRALAHALQLSRECGLCSGYFAWTDGCFAPHLGADQWLAMVSNLWLVVLGTLDGLGSGSTILAAQGGAESNCRLHGGCSGCLLPLLSNHSRALARRVGDWPAIHHRVGALCRHLCGLR